MTPDEITLRRRCRRCLAVTACVLIVLAVLPRWLTLVNFHETTTHRFVDLGQPLPVAVLYQVRGLPDGQPQLSEWYVSRTGLANAAIDLLLLGLGLVWAWWLLHAGRRLLWLRAAGVVLVFMAAIFVVIFAGAVLRVDSVSAWHQVREARREAWINRAVKDVAQWTADPAWIAAQRQAATPPGRTQPDAETVLPHFLAMTNGEWIAFCQEAGKVDPTIDDVFVGKGSDGKWYYSEFHFCVNMISARMMVPFASLADFVAQVDHMGGESSQVSTTATPPAGAAHRIRLRDLRRH